MFLKKTYLEGTTDLVEWGRATHLRTTHIATLRDSIIVVLQSRGRGSLHSCNFLPRTTTKR
jgi:hypothetical protein